ncbi:ferritin-like domain-containing protein [Sorangium sp. So ce131]|uniref:ferritin-like domain-containing protein n=1 Tax=Sorangium sp. So ce131 TaxID=3133282 RepID=UPI003F612066
MNAPVLDLRERARARALDVSGYPEALFPSAIRTWRGRMVNEYTSSAVFEALARQLAEARFSPELVDTCLGFAREEREHGILCGAVVESLGGVAAASLPERAEFPLHRDAPPRAAVLRNVIHICCMSETVAVALIGAERLEMPPGPLLELLTRIYADEVGHARFGWRLLDEVAPTLSAEERSAVERYLPVAFRHLVAHEHAHLPPHDAPPEGEQLGLCSGLSARSLLDETIDQVIRPGLGRFFAC